MSMDIVWTGSLSYSCSVLLFWQQPSGVQRKREAALFGVTITGYSTNLHFYWQALIMATINANNMHTQNLQTDWLTTQPHTYTHTIWIHTAFRFIWRYPLWLWVHPPFISLYSSPPIFLSLCFILSIHTQNGVWELHQRESCLMYSNEMRHEIQMNRTQKEMRCGGGK